MQITTAISEKQLMQATADMIPYVLERNIAKIMYGLQPQIDQLIRDTLFGRENRGEMRELIEQAIKESVKEVITDMLRDSDG